MNNVPVPCYAGLVEAVYPYLGDDFKGIRDFAEACDSHNEWENPDNDEAPSTLFSREIAAEDSLYGLGCLYKRLKSGVDVPEVIFQNILRKMFWLANETLLAMAA